MELFRLRAHEIHDLLKNGEISARELIESLFNQIEKTEDSVKAYISLNKKEALKKSDEVDKHIKSGKDFDKLFGIPVAVKDIINTKGILTTCGSQILSNYIPPYDATVMVRLNEEGIIIVGKTNMDEFAMGSSTENSSYWPTRNPHDLDRVPGGSSGGSAAAIAADEAILALGTDTGGSIRQPAAFCGVVGMKPTYGLVSRYGLIAFASSLDQIGPITKDVTDCALLLNYITGYDPKDSTSLKYEKPDYLSFLGADIKGMKIGVPKEIMELPGFDEDIKDNFKEALKNLENLGASVDFVSLRHFDYALSAYYIIAPAEASSNLSRHDGVRYGVRVKGDDLFEMYTKTRGEGFGDEVKRRIMLGTYALSAGYYEAYYGKAQKIRTLIMQDFEEAYKKFDLLVTPTSPTVAFKIGERLDNPLAMYLSDICTIPVNLAGLPGISIPCGYSQNLPLGLQIIGNHFGEGDILKVAHAYEKSYPFERKKI
ncbi:MAG: Asp-tRNA(Asn)/Glu-tRNA(Gln) amidotransferase subunit GatA [Actinomycetia bacterium]|nr:Asp-tRNA(Asn)/Glu-tRNA(Gln) amidotransferase subunit GatA [Actinomycetes bacterium]